MDDGQPASPPKFGSDPVSDAAAFAAATAAVAAVAALEPAQPAQPPPDATIPPLDPAASTAPIAALVPARAASDPRRGRSRRPMHSHRRRLRAEPHVAR